MQRSFESPRRLAALLALAACLLAISFLAVVQSAAAETSLCQPGSGAGQCNNPQGIATDFETGHVYLADRDNNRVDVFEASGGSFVLAFGWGVDTGDNEFQTCTTASTCQAGIAGAGDGELNHPVAIAVDNVVGSASRHDVYVFDSGNARIQKFSPTPGFLLKLGAEGTAECKVATAADSNVAVGPAGNVYVGSSTSVGDGEFTNIVEKFDPAGNCLASVALSPKNRFKAIAVDSAGSIYGAFTVLGGIRKFHPDGSEYTAPPYPLDLGMETNALAIDSGDDLFAAQREPTASGLDLRLVLTEYGSNGSHLRRFGYGKLKAASLGIAAFHGAEGDLFASEVGADTIRYLTIPPPGPIVVPESVEAVAIGNTKAKVKAEVNPEGKATEVHIDYVDRAGFEADVEGGGDGFEGSGTKSTEPQPLNIPAGREFRLNGTEVPLGCPTASKELIEEGICLSPETEYRFRIVATNADNPTGTGEGTVVGVPFETKRGIDIKELFATGVATDTATVNAVVNPLGIPASGYFEYVDDTQFKASGFANAAKAPNVDAGQAEVDFGSGEAGVRQSATLFPLKAGTAYHYRVRAGNALIEEHLASEEATFRTFASEGSEACPANEAFRTGASALLPDCRAYELVSPLDKGSGDIVALGEGLTALPATLNQSSLAGNKLAYGSYRAFGDAKSAPYTSQYIAARGAGSWQSHAISPPHGPRIKEVANTLNTEFRAFSADLCQSWLTPFFDPPLAAGAIPGYENLYRRTDEECGGPGYEALSTVKPPSTSIKEYFLELQGLSADGTVAAFLANDNLSEDAPPQPPGCVECQPRLYLQAGGQLRFACVLPGGEASKGSCTAGSVPALSVGTGRTATLTNALTADGQRVFWTAGAGAFTSEGQIYLRENPFGEGPECAEASSPCTIAVSKAAEALSKTSASRYWIAAKDGSKAIFTTGGSEDLYEFDVASEATKKIAGGVSGVLGASEDASRLYFASGEILSPGEENEAGEEAEAGKPNLYLHEAGPGSGAYRFIGVLSGADSNQQEPSPLAHGPNFHTAQVSADGLHTAFTSFAPLSGYDNTDAKSGKADTEVFLYDAVANAGAGKLLCASCNPAGARPAGANVDTEPNPPFWVAGRIPVYENSLYAPHVLSGDGSRLFFESQDALASRDSNGRIDVYQWERAGTGGCKEGSPSFSAASGGCVDLISSGQSERNSEIIDAGASGEDVFFATLAGLLPQDYGLIDVYDARVGGGFPSPPPPGPECEGEGCQSPAAPPPFSAPATALNLGPGNEVAKKKKKHARKPHRKHRRHRRAA